MAKTYNKMIIDVNDSINSIGIRPVQGDTKSRYLDVCLYDNGLPVDLTGEMVRINFQKEDGATFFNQGEITDATAGRCQFALTNEILAESKAVKAQISIWNADGEILSTQVFTILVSESIRNDEAVESENEFGVLVVLFQEIQNALDLMQAISDNFGEPGEKAAEYGVDTFWGILETLAGRADVETVLSYYIKNVLNSTVYTSDFAPLDELITEHGMQIFMEDDTFVVPNGIHKIWVTACGGGGGGGAGGYTTSYSGSDGERGGSTVLSGLVTLPGGYGGGKGNGRSGGAGGSCGIGGGAGGAGGNNEYAGSTGGESARFCYGAGGIGGETSTYDYPGGGGGGGGGGYGAGGAGSTAAGIVYLEPGSDGGPGAGGGGGGGAGGSSSSYGTGGGGGGGGGSLLINQVYSVTPGQSIPITIGAGGAGGASYNNHDNYGGNGGDGFVIIEW